MLVLVLATQAMQARLAPPRDDQGLTFCWRVAVLVALPLLVALVLEIGRIYMGNYAGQAPGDLQGIPQSYDPAHGVLYVCYVCYANNANIAVECSVSDSAQKRRLACTYPRRS